VKPGGNWVIVTVLMVSDGAFPSMVRVGAVPESEHATVKAATAINRDAKRCVFCVFIFLPLWWVVPHIGPRLIPRGI
jgi:hypothetical protein